MTNYKNYLLRAMGVKEGQVKPSIVERNAFPGIDPDELEKGAEDEKEEHGMDDEDAYKTATQHLKEPEQHHYYSGMDKAKRQGMLRDALFGGGALSPTAIPTPIIGMSVRGSSTGGFPSGVDQVNTDISPSNLGGYEKIPIETVNSKLIDKTPQNSEINQSSTPINDNPSTGKGVTHPHQIQRDAGEEPQAVTGASTDSDDTLTLKSAMPKGVSVDIAQEGNNEEEEEDEEYKSSSGNGNPNMESGMGTGMSTVTEGKHKAGCKCGFCANKGKFGKKSDKEDKKEKKFVTLDGDSVPESEIGKKNKKEEKSEKDLNETFARHLKLMKEKIEENTPDENVGAEEPFATKWKMDKEKAGMVKLNENKEGLVHLSEAFEKMQGLAGIGKVIVSSNGVWNKTVNEEKWMQDSSKPSTKGALHKDLGIPEDKKIPTEKLKSLQAMLHKKSEKGTLSDKELTLSRRVNAALNMRGGK